MIIQRRFPKHHTVDRLVTVEQEELNKRIVKQEQEAKTKSKSKKEESGKTKNPSQLSVVSDQQDPDLTPPQTPVKMPGNRDEERTHYWSLRDIPKFEGKKVSNHSHILRSLKIIS